MKDVAVAATKSATSEENRVSKPTDKERAAFFAKIKPKMSPKEVIALIGEPDKMTSEFTKKQWIPFYFGPDTRRATWSYSGIGYVNFVRNKYTGSLSVVKFIYDKKAP
jgi:hypothetical protein